MITIDTYLYSNDHCIGYQGHGSLNCPYCGTLTDVGTGEHAKPDLTHCSCGKWFRYWPTGRVAKARQPKIWRPNS